jgi:hypothetical protein
LDILEIFDQIKNKKKPANQVLKQNNIVVKKVIETNSNKNKKKCCQ